MFFIQFFLDDRRIRIRTYLTNGSGCGSGRPKNIWILRIRIRNTASQSPQMRARNLKTCLLCSGHVGEDGDDPGSDRPGGDQRGLCRTDPRLPEGMGTLREMN
jgi:hypothetical protein